MSPLKSSLSLRRWFRHSWQILLGVFLGVFGLAYVAWGATYNFYFNNTEQGDNSTATPSVTVGEDGKVVKKPGIEAPAKTEPAPEAVPPPSAVSAATVSEVEPPQQEHDPRWRFALGVTSVKAYGGGGSATYDSTLQPSASVSFFFNRDIGLTMYGATLPGSIQAGGETYVYDSSSLMVGLEVELVPIHISIGRFDNLIELGVLGGVQAEYSSQSNYDAYSGYGDSSNYLSQWSIRPEGGIRVGLNFGRHWGIIGDIRAIQDFATGEVALALKL